MPGLKPVSRKPIQVPERTWEIIRLEAIRQTFKRRQTVTMGEVIRTIAEQLNRKHSHVK